MSAIKVIRSLSWYQCSPVFSMISFAQPHLSFFIDRWFRRQTRRPRFNATLHPLHPQSGRKPKWSFQSGRYFQGFNANIWADIVLMKTVLVVFFWWVQHNNHNDTWARRKQHTSSTCCDVRKIQFHEEKGDRTVLPCVFVLPRVQDQVHGEHQHLVDEFKDFCRVDDHLWNYLSRILDQFL